MQRSIDESCQGHHLWNGAQVVTDYLYDRVANLVHGRTVLELGAGAGLPSIAAAIWGAKQVVVTDYPDVDLVENMQMNIEAAKDVLAISANIVAKVSLSMKDTVGVCMLKLLLRDMYGVPPRIHCFRA